MGSVVGMGKPVCPIAAGRSVEIDRVIVDLPDSVT